MVLVRALAVFRLRRQDIVVLDQKKMMMAGQLDVILFDKTGTLTIDEVCASFGACPICNAGAAYPLQASVVAVC